MSNPSTHDDAWADLCRGIVPTRRLSADDAELVDIYGPLVEASSPLTIAQLAQSLDGFIATRTGDAQFVTGEADRAHLHRLRALVDAVVIGAGTVTADDCQLTVRAVKGENPVRVIVDPHARVPEGATVLTSDAAPTLWLVGENVDAPSPHGAHVDVLRLHQDAFTPTGILTLLHGRGLTRVLVEGGGDTVSRFVTAGVLDRLFITTAPFLIGDGVPGVRFDGIDVLSEVARPATRRFVFGDDVCVELDLSTRPASG